MNINLSEEAVYWIYQIRQACHLYDENKRDEAFNMLEQFNKTPLRSNVLTLMGEYLCEPQNKPIHDDLMDTWRYNVPDVSTPTDRNLIKRSLDIYRGRFGEDIGYGVYNLISILKNTRGDLSGEDLSELDLSRCMLNGTPLSRKGFRANFHGAKINRSTIFSAGHKGDVNDVCYSPNGKFIATASDDGTVIIRDTRTYAVAAVINGHSESVNTVRYTRNGDCILTASKDGSVKIWNAQTNNQMVSLDHFMDYRLENPNDDYDFPVRASVSPDGACIATWSPYDNRICIWDAGTFERSSTIEAEMDVYDLIFHPDSKAVAVKLGNNDDGYRKAKRIELWDIAEESSCFSFDISQYGMSRLLCFTPNKSAILCQFGANHDRHIFRLNTIQPASFDMLEIIGEPEIDTAGARNSSDGNELIVLGGHSSGKDTMDDGDVVLLVLDPNTMTVKRSVDVPLGEIEQIQSAALSPDDSHIAIAPYLSGHDLIIVDIKECKVESTIRSATASINSLAFFADGRHFVTTHTTGENTLRIWNTMTGTCVSELDGGAVDISTAAVTPDMSTLIVAYYDGSIELYDVVSLNFVGKLDGHSEQITTIACASDSRYAATADFDDQVMIWDLAACECIGRIPCQKLVDPETFEHVRDIRFLPSGNISVLSIQYTVFRESLPIPNFSGGSLPIPNFSGSFLSIWNISGKRIDLLNLEKEHYDSICSATDAEVILCGSSGYAEYDLLSHTKLRGELCPNHDIYTKCLCGTRDIAVVCTNEVRPDKATLYVIDTHTGATLSEVCFFEYVYGARFSPDGKRLFVWFSRGKLTLLDPASCRVLGDIDMHSGVNIFGCDMRDLHIDSRLTYDDIEDLRRYGAIID